MVLGGSITGEEKSTAVVTSTSERPPTYEESMSDPAAAAVASVSAGGPVRSAPEVPNDVQISMQRIPETITTSLANLSVSGSTHSDLSVEEMQKELNALQWAHLHLYQRFQHVRKQTYGALALVFVVAFLVVVFLATHHTGQSGKPERFEMIGHRSGKALHQESQAIASSALMATADNGVERKDDTDLLMKHIHNLSSPATLPSDTKGDAIERSAPHQKEQPDNDLTSDHHLDDVKLFDIEQVHRSQDDKSVTTTVAPSTTVVGSSTSTTTPSPSTSTTTTMSTTEAETESSSTTTTTTQLPDKSSYKISILVHSATVPNMDYAPLGRASDTFCDVYVDNTLVASTPTIDNNNNPNWQYLLPKTYNVERDSVVRIEVFDRDHLKKDSVGFTVVSVRELINTKRLDRPVKFYHGRGDIWVTFKLF